jgi:Papain family cysteine protease
MVFATYGELRAHLRDEGITWTVNPNFADDDPIERPHLGALPEALVPADPAERIDVHVLLAERPPTNALLHAELIERGVLPREGAAGGPAPTGGTRPASVDWRSRWGWPWITGIRDQNGSEHCWIFAPTALVESMVRIEHAVWCVRSEGDYIGAQGVVVGQCGDPVDPLNWYASNGITDINCVPWPDLTGSTRTGAYWSPVATGCGTGSTQHATYTPCHNRNGRTVRIPAYTTLGNVEDQKNWIDTVGPLVVGFDVYSDFFGWSGTTPYVKAPGATLQGGHIMVVVGYDDNAQCWIVKNSWGTNYGNNGWYLIKYGECNIDLYWKYGLRGTNPDPWTKRRLHAGGLLEAGNGALHCNFELLAPAPGGPIAHWWRENGGGPMTWSKAELFANDAASRPTHTATTYNRNFETIFTTPGGRLHHWWFDQNGKQWHDGGIFGPSGCIGQPGLTESGYGPGNFEVVVATQAHTLTHWWRDPSFTWHAGTTFGSGVAAAGPSLLQTSYGTNGNLELVCQLTSGQLQHWWRDDDHGFVWHAGPTFAAKVSSPPCLIQGQFGMSNENAAGNFELCVALNDGTVQHWWRDNTGGTGWHLSATFGSNVAAVVGLLEGSYGFNLEVVVLRHDGMLQHYWRSGGQWNAGVLIGSTN